MMFVVLKLKIRETSLKSLLDPRQFGRDGF
jgi:hypothetical protein